jgi:uncharacterized membrane protein
LTVAAAVIYISFGIVQWETFRVGSYDLVIFDQAVRSYAHFRPGISPLNGVQDGFGAHFSVLGDHWSPALALLAPAYWISDGPRTLAVAQGVLLALAIPPLWSFTRRAAPAIGVRGVPGEHSGQAGTVAAYCVAVSYALSWPVAEALGIGFHQVAFVPVLTAVFFERLQAGRTGVALAAVGALLLVKEDMGLLVAGFGLYLLVTRRQALGGALITGGVAATWLATFVLRPAFGGRATYYWTYPALGPGLRQAAWHVIAHPLSTLHLMVSPDVKLGTMALLAGVLLFLPLASPVSLAAVPLLAERMLDSVQPNWWSVHFQYNSCIEVVLVCAAVDGAVRISRHLGGARSGDAWFARLAALLCVAAVAVVPFFSLGSLARPGFYAQTARMQAASAAAAAVPSGVVVDAADMLGPRLSGRDTVLLWGPAAHTAAWIVAQTYYTFPFGTKAAQLAELAQLRRGGYAVVFSRDGYLVLHRG